MEEQVIKKAWVINLETRKDKLKEFNSQYFPFFVERFSGLLAAKVGLGCTLSHLTILEKKHTFPFIVFEDDCTIIESWDVLDKAINQLPNDWDMLYLGANVTAPVIHYSENLVRLKGAWMAHAIIYNSQSVIDYILSNRKIPEKVIIDDFYRTNVHAKFNCFMVTPMMAVQRPGKSDVRGGRFRDYTNVVKSNFEKYVNYK